MLADTSAFKAINRQRRAGVLLHPTSLPGDLLAGDIGHQAYRFIEFLNRHGFKVWQMLPLGPTHDDKSPYQCLSSHAGNPLLISLDWLHDKNWLDKQEHHISDGGEKYRFQCLQQSADNFYKNAGSEWKLRLDEFCHHHKYWLDDYALFMALKIKYNNTPWYEWPKEIRHRDAASLSALSDEMGKEILQVKFEQFVFFTQWHEIRKYAKKHNIELFGDMPIFVARDSADVWAERKIFLMDAEGNMSHVSGVPPDAFSETGQRWGNPLFNWDYMQQNNFSWWKRRFTTQLKLFDFVRIDHFRGLQACWQIPQSDKTAINGKWVTVPGKKLLTELFKTYKDLPLVAEDLGVITDEVLQLKNDFNLPGMKVLQFAFDGNNQNPHLPHHHHFNDAIYTGTHDNDTTLGWLSDESNYNKDYLEDYLSVDVARSEKTVMEIIRAAMASVSFLCILPLQDILMQDSSSRMNTPGTIGGNWNWRFDWQQIKPEVLEKISKYMGVYQR